MGFPKSSLVPLCVRRPTPSLERSITGRSGWRPEQWGKITSADPRREGALAAPNFLLKIIPHVDGTPRICELVQYLLDEIEPRRAWAGPAALAQLPCAAPGRRASSPGSGFDGPPRRRPNARPREGVHDYLALRLRKEEPTPQIEVSPNKWSASAPQAGCRSSGGHRKRERHLGIAFTFAREGAKVVIADLDQNAAENAAL